mmetsp:Transcript_62575/g.174444  ORF Transcript_62575/g.174444 Transcript_62575/m.174444 type:complete len:101 (-) Transcript_62575:149-451(-)
MPALLGANVGTALKPPAEPMTIITKNKDWHRNATGAKAQESIANCKGDGLVVLEIVLRTLFLPFVVHLRNIAGNVDLLLKRKIAIPFDHDIRNSAGCQRW